MSNEVKVRFIPVCECGHQLEGLASYERFIELDENSCEWRREYSITHCPNCSKKLKGFEFPKIDYFGRLDY